MFFQNLARFVFDPVWLPIALAHITLVLIYAKWRGWGHISLFGIVALPGGAIPYSPPIWETLAVLWFSQSSNPSDTLIYLVAAHMLRVRIITLATFVLFAIFGKKVICMDDRTWQTVDSVPNGSASNHDGACGGLDTLTFWGFFPLMAVFAILSVIGIQLPVYIVASGLLPIVFLGAKHFKIPFFGMISDVIGNFERPGQYVATLYTGKTPHQQHCHFH